MLYSEKPEDYLTGKQNENTVPRDPEDYSTGKQT